MAVGKMGAKGKQFKHSEGIYFIGFGRGSCCPGQNVMDITNICHDLEKEGYSFTTEDPGHLSTYMTEHIKRFGESVLDLIKKPDNLSQTRDRAVFDLSNVSIAHVS